MPLAWIISGLIPPNNKIEKRKYIFCIFQFPGGNSEWVPPDSISNSVVKTLSADDSVGSPHVKVGHCQDLILKTRKLYEACAFFFGLKKML